MRRHRRVVTAIAVPLGVAAALCASLGTARVDGTSMTPSVTPGSTVVFERLTTPSRGDLVIFERPAAWNAPDGLLVKRVIGVAGDTVRCCEAGTGRLVVNGEPIAESYVTDERPGGTTLFAVTVADGAIWVMGDNRSMAGSHDSRDELNDSRHGMLTVDHLRGVVRGIL